jgi:Zn-finger nucleic acid-binding protein
MPYVRCPECHGSGRNRRLMPIQRGALGIRQECPRCGGDGRVWQDEKIIIEHRHYGEDYRDERPRRSRVGGVGCLLPLLSVVVTLIAVVILVFALTQ